MARPLSAKADCPRPAIPRPGTHARTLHRACLILGGVAQLAAHLGVAEGSLRAWLEGREEPPQMVFLAGVEIVLLHLERAAGAH